MDLTAALPPSAAPGDELPATAEVVVVGGGVMGASIAHHLTAAGVTDVVVVEAGALGGGSSGKPLGGVRAQFSGAANVALGARSLRAYERFADEFDTDIGLRQVGYLFLLRAHEVLEAFRASTALQARLGVDNRLVDVAEARELCPWLEPDVASPPVIAAAFSPRDGYARPGAVVQAYARSAQRRGARFVTGTRVTGIDARAGAVVGVRTDRGDVACATVVCAAGAWSRAIGAMVGLDLPVSPVRRQIAFSPPMDPHPRVPFTIDYDSTLYFHPSDDGLLVGWADPAQAAGFDVSYDASWLPSVRSALRRCVPAVADLPLHRGWAGLYEMTPDHDALIGAAEDPRGFLYATGFSGHGFLQAPAVGEVVRDLHLGVTPVVDVQGFDARRFAGAAARTELAIV